jgi:hypothetical protein
MKELWKTLTALWAAVRLRGGWKGALTEGLATQLEETLLLVLLERVRPLGQKSAALFHAVAERFPQTAIETVIFKRHEGRVMVYLNKRPNDDPFFPGQWVLFGTVMRAYDNSFADGIARLEERELGGIRFGRVEQVGILFGDTPRGKETLIVFAAELSGDRSPTTGSWFYADALPPNLAERGRKVVALAVRSFEESKALEAPP